MAGKYGQTPVEILTGDTINTSECMEFYFYYLFWYWYNKTDKTEVKIGRYIVVSHWVGSSLCYWVLSEKGNIIARTNVQHAT